MIADREENFYFFYTKAKDKEHSSYFELTDYDRIPEYLALEGCLFLGADIRKLLKFCKWNVDETFMRIESGIRQVFLGNVEFENFKYQGTLICMAHDNILIHMSKINESIDTDRLSDIKIFEFLQLMFENSNEAMSLLTVKDDNIEYLYNNREHQKITGFSHEEISGRELCEVLGNDYYKEYEQKMFSCIRKMESVTFNGLACWNGVVKERLCKLVPIFYKNNNYIYAVEVDTESLTTWMNNNSISVTKFDQMFHLHLSIMMIIEPISGKIIDANPAAISFYGYSLEELTQMTIQDINTLTDEEVEMLRQEAAKKGRLYFLFRHRLKNGEIRMVDVHSSPIEINNTKYLFSIITDATEREHNEEELYKEKELQRITMDSIADCVVTTDKDGKITYLNKSALSVIECESQEAIGKYFDKVLPMVNEFTNVSVANIVQNVLQSLQEQELENHTMLRTMHGNMIPIEDSAAPILDKKKGLYGAVVIFRDVTLAKEKKKKIEYLSYHDELTGLYNRRFYYDNIDNVQSDNLYPLGYIMGDVNGLKMTNDVFGHDMGDKLLKTISNILQKCVSKEDMVIRWGGDEFVIIIPHSSTRRLEVLIEKIKKELKAIRINDVIELSISFGIAIKKQKWEPTDYVLKKAEEMMYQIKLLESKSMRGNTVNALMTTLDEKSEETRDHTIRLSDICIKVSKELELPAEIQNSLVLLAVLHDIGKVGIPDHILGKPGALSKDEWDVMRTHTEIGYRIASNVPELHVVANEILHHHEKWDGSGYPSGLKGETIPINCRILAVVDSYDAMTNDRVYRKAMSHEKAMEELKRYAGSQFDPKVVEVFERIK